MVYYGSPNMKNFTAFLPGISCPGDVAQDLIVGRQLLPELEGSTRTTGSWSSCNCRVKVKGIADSLFISSVLSIETSAVYKCHDCASSSLMLP